MPKTQPATSGVVINPLLSEVASRIAALAADEASKKRVADDAKAELSAAREHGIRRIAEQFDRLCGLNHLTDDDKSAFLDVFAKALKEAGADDKVIKTRKSETKVFLDQRHNVMAALNAVDDLKTEVDASDLDPKPPINTRQMVLKILRTIRQRELDAAAGKPGVRLTSVEEEIAAIRNSIFADPETPDERDQLLQMLGAIERSPLLQVASVSVAGATELHPEAARLLSALRRLVLDEDDAATGVASVAPVAPADEADGDDLIDDLAELEDYAEKSDNVDEPGVVDVYTSVILQAPTDEALLDDDEREAAEIDLDELTRGIL
jgi:cell division protein ZapA (FtsZ GTPase activity inhibitor)